MKKRQTKKAKPKKHWSKLLWKAGACSSGVTYAEQFDTPAEAYLHAIATNNIDYLIWALYRLLSESDVSALRLAINPNDPTFITPVDWRRVIQFIDLLPTVEDIRAITRGVYPWEWVYYESTLGY